MKASSTTAQQHNLAPMTAYEREVFDLAIEALKHPITAREAWFVYSARQMKRANELLGKA